METRKSVVTGIRRRDVVRATLRAIEIVFGIPPVVQRTKFLH